MFVVVMNTVPQVIQYALRDYIQYWYYTLSEDESFLLEIRQTLQNALVQFSTRYLAHTHMGPIKVYHDQLSSSLGIPMLPCTQSHFALLDSLDSMDPIFS